MARRICLIVDHPLRDLEGLVLVACELARRGLEAFLVPMYHRHEVFLICPDLVLVNYVRFANIGFIDACRHMGIAVGVLDTEGGVQKDVDAFARRVCPYLDRVALYCAWGPRQLAALRACSPDGAGSLVATGCPRYDFAAPRWRGAIKNDGEAWPRPLILIDTNFPIINPRFQSARREVIELVKGMAYDSDYVRELIRQTHMARDELVRTADRLAAIFPQVLFVIRPHPFERADYYQSFFHERPNVRVIQQGTIFEWAVRAAAIVHHNCSTAIDGFLMGVEPIHLAWVDSPLLYQPVSVAVSQHATSLDHLVALVGGIVGGQEPIVPEDLAERRQRIVEDFFFANDGEAAVRVVDAVIQVLGRKDCASLTMTLVSVIQALARSQRYDLLRLLAFLLGGRRLQYWLLRLLRPERLNPAKVFGVEDVAGIVRRVGSVVEVYRSVEVRSAGPSHPWPGAREPLTSIRVARPGSD